MKHIMIRVFLWISGLLLLVVGMAVLFQPHVLLPADIVMPSTDPDVLSELRAPGGLLLVSSLVILLGAVRNDLHRPALMLSALVYGTYGVSRLVSMALDGLPSSSLVAAAGVELLVGLLSLVFLFGRAGELSNTTARRVLK